MPLDYDKRNPDHKEPIVCLDCQNTGRIIKISWGHFAGDQEYEDCDKCKGTGYLTN